MVVSTTQERVDGTVDGERDAVRAILDRQRHAFAAEGPPSVAVRRNRIDRLLALVLDNADAFVCAMAADFGTRPKTKSLFTEVLGMISVIEHTRSHVPQWMRATKLRRAARLFALKAVAVGCRRNHRPVELPVQSRRAACRGGVRGR
jgi:coniferyl-aldehyde dehydrogenase